MKYNSNVVSSLYTKNLKCEVKNIEKMIKIFYIIRMISKEIKKMSKEERGSTLIEMMGVIAVIGVLASSTWMLINSALEKHRISAAAAQLHSLQKGITRYYASAGNYDGLKKESAIQDLIDNHIPPKNMIFGTTLRHSFNGTVIIKNVEYSDISTYGNTSDSFTIQFNALPKKACAELASIAWLEYDSVNLMSIQIGSNKYVWPSYSSGDTYTLPVTEGKAMQDCASGSTNIVWEFR